MTIIQGKDDMNAETNTDFGRSKLSYVRSKKLLKAARALPCQHCGQDDGTVVAAHTNWGGGKGRGIKASDDLIASLCFRCHFDLDQGANLTKNERQVLWQAAHERTVKKLCDNGLWPIDVPRPL
jgi:hypothetical protein